MNIKKAGLFIIMILLFFLSACSSGSAKAMSLLKN
jgi:hypothetical protein